MTNFLKSAFIVFFLSSAPSLHAQIYTTLNNFTGPWENPASWVSGSQPNPLTTGINDEADVYGYITLNGSLSFANIGANSKYFTIRDTLVVQGNMTFENNSVNLRIADGGLLVVFGDFTANNKVTLDNGGILVVTGDLTLNGGQNEYVDGGGSLYVDGTISGNGDTAAADAIDQPSTNLDGSSDEGEQSLFNFIAGSGETPLPIVLNYFEARPLNDGILLSWETLTEENFDYFEIQHSENGLDFEVIGTVEGHGFSSNPHQYAFADHTPATGWNFYRLRAIDFDGTYEVFEVIKIENRPDFSAVRLYPNPGSGEFINISVPEKLLSGQPVNLTVVDVNGAVLLRQEVTSSQVSTPFQSKLAPGLYIVSLQTMDYTTSLRLLVN